MALCTKLICLLQFLRIIEANSEASGMLHPIREVVMIFFRKINSIGHFVVNSLETISQLNFITFSLLPRNIVPLETIKISFLIILASEFIIVYLRYDLEKSLIIAL